MKRKQLFILPVMMILLMGMSKCDRYAKTGQLARDFAAGVSAFQQAEIVMHNQGKISDPEHVAIQDAILQTAQAGKDLDRAINQVHSAPDARAALDAALMNVQTALNDGVAHVKNPDAKASLQTSIVLLRSILDNIRAIGG